MAKFVALLRAVRAARVQSELERRLRNYAQKPIRVASTNLPVWAEPA